MFSVSLDICTLCNFDCPYCSVDVIDISSTENRIMPIKHITILVNYINAYLPQMNIRYCIRGGEPLLSCHIPEIMEELKKTKNLYEITMLTNGAIPLEPKDINFKDISRTRISFHFTVMKRLGFTKYYSIMLNNMAYLLENDAKLDVFLIKDKCLSDIELQNYKSEICNRFSQYDIDKSIREIKVFPANNYKDDTYDYSKLPSLYNLGIDTPVYYKRAIKVKPNGYCFYLCDLADCKQNYIKYNYIQNPKMWKNIARQINDKVVCTWDRCIYPVYELFCFEE